MIATIVILSLALIVVAGFYIRERCILKDSEYYYTQKIVQLQYDLEICENIQKEKIQKLDNEASKFFTGFE